MQPDGPMMALRQPSFDLYSSCLKPLDSPSSFTNNSKRHVAEFICSSQFRYHKAQKIF